MLIPRKALQLFRRNNTFFTAVSQVLLIPIDYVDLYGFRLILLRVLPVIFILFLYGNSIVNPLHLSLSVAIIFYEYMLGESIKGSEYLYSSIIFFLIALWPLAVKKRGEGMYYCMMHYYVLVAIAQAILLLLQVSLYIISGDSFGRFIEYPNRAAFSIFWSDFSFLSLYFVSTIPICLYIFNSMIIRIVISFLLFTASAATSARTGVVSLFLYFFAYNFVMVMGGVLRGVIFPRKLALLTLAPALAGLGFVLIWFLAGRLPSFSLSGRAEGIMAALEMWWQRPILGLRFQLEHFLDTASEPRPHNVIVEWLLLGGSVFFLMCFTWVYHTAKKIAKSGGWPIFHAVGVCLVGMLFIPSFFSAYFLAVLISMGWLNFREMRGAGIQR